MAKKKLPKEFIDNMFKPGQSGNPGGQTKGAMRIKKLSKEQFAEVVDLIIQGNLEELKALAQNPKATVLKQYVAKAVDEGMKRGDWGMLNSLLDRLIGKPKEDVQLSVLRRVVKKLDGSEVHYTNQLPGEEESDE